MTELAPLIISVAGAVIAFLTTALCTILAFLGRFALATIDKRVDDKGVRIQKLEEASATYAVQLASQKTQTEAESRQFAELASSIADVREDIKRVVDVVGELNVAVRRNATPTYPIKRQP